MAAKGRAHCEAAGLSFHSLAIPLLLSFFVTRSLHDGFGVFREPNRSQFGTQKLIVTDQCVGRFGCTLIV